MRGTQTHQIAILGQIGNGSMTIDELHDRLPIEKKALSKSAGILIERGLVERLEKGVFQLSEAGKALLAEGAGIPRYHRPRKMPVQRNCLLQRAWAAMRLQKVFTIPDIMLLAGEQKDYDTIQSYVSRLAKAGYVAEMQARVPGTSLTSNGYKKWRLVRDTGENMPRYVPFARYLRDGNTGETFSCGTLDEVAA